MRLGTIRFVTGAALTDVLDSTAFEVVRNVGLFLVAVFWLGLAYRVYRDARRRIDDSWLVATAALVGLVPFVGPLVYLLFRPPETLADVRAREIEVRALKTRLVAKQPACPVCRSGIEPDFLVCPVCTTQLKQPCVTCAKPLEPLWQACPYCATPVGAKVETIGLDQALTAEAIAVPQRKKRAAGSRARAS